MYRREFLLLLLFAQPGNADSRDIKISRRKKCVAINHRIKRLESKLRQGHSGKQGRAWKRQARDLQLERHRFCR